MTRLITSSVATAALLTLFSTADVADAQQRVRSAIDRKHSPNLGFWESKSSQSRGGSFNRSYVRNAPRNYVRPQQAIASEPSIVRQQRVIPPAATMRSSGIVNSQPIIGAPVVTHAVPVDRSYTTGPVITGHPVIGQPVIGQPVVTGGTVPGAAPVQSVPHIGQPAWPVNR